MAFNYKFIIIFALTHQNDMIFYQMQRKKARGLNKKIRNMFFGKRNAEISTRAT